MTEACASALSKPDVDRFFQSKHIIGCPTCGRSQPLGVDVRVLGCQQISPTKTQSEPLTVLVIACENCGAIQFYDCGVIAEWLECHNRVRSA